MDAAAARKISDATKYELSEEELIQLKILYDGIESTAKKGSYTALFDVFDGMLNVFFDKLIHDGYHLCVVSRNAYSSKLIVSWAPSYKINE